MNYWLVKFAPFFYFWQDVSKIGRFEIYSVRNPQARNYLKEMKLGNQVLFYHSQKGNEIMGLMKVVEEAHQDPTTVDDRWLLVTFEPVRSLDNPVSLQEIKKEPKLANTGLFRLQRLAVMRLEKEEFEVILLWVRYES